MAHLPPEWKRHADPAWLEGWEAMPLEVRGGTTEAVRMGSGPSLVLLPPLPGFKESWLGVARLLARRFDVVTCDLRVRFDGAPHWDVLLEDLERVLDAAAPGPAIVVGHSFGGALAQRWAIARPQRVRALVLSSSFARVTTPQGDGFGRYVEQPVVLAALRLLPERPALAFARAVAAREGWVFDRRCDDTLLGFVNFCIRKVPVAAALNAVRLAFEHDTRAALERLRCPTLVLVGERETRFARGAAADLARDIAGATLAVSPGVAHLHPLSSPEWFARTVVEWLDARGVSDGVPARA